MVVGEEWPGETATLATARSRVTVAAVGGGISVFDIWDEAENPVAVLMPATGILFGGCQLLVPWSNRISGGGFVYDGRFHPVSPNVENEPYPLHGDGFQRTWRLHQVGADYASLLLDDGAIGPYRYRADVTYRLSATHLRIRLGVTNRGEVPLPFGLGFHPWFPRVEGTLLKARSATIQLQDSNYLPTEIVSTLTRPDLDFSAGNALPGGWINNAIGGWDRSAKIVYPSGLEVNIRVSEAINKYLVYSPSAGSKFFCFEPVSHMVDAHRDNQLQLRRLAPGASMVAEVSIAASLPAATSGQ